MKNEDQAGDHIVEQAGMHGLVARSALSAEERAQVEGLAALCNKEEGIELPVNLEPSNTSEQANQFLHFESGTLVGFASLEGVNTPEATGMVHPEHRRKGIGRELLHALKEECRLRG